MRAGVRPWRSGGLLLPRDDVDGHRLVLVERRRPIRPSPPPRRDDRTPPSRRQLAPVTHARQPTTPRGAAKGAPLRRGHAAHALRRPAVPARPDGRGPAAPAGEPRRPLDGRRLRAGVRDAGGPGRLARLRRRRGPPLARARRSGGRPWAVAGDARADAGARRRSRSLPRARAEPARARPARAPPPRRPPAAPRLAARGLRRGRPLPAGEPRLRRRDAPPPRRGALAAARRGRPHAPPVPVRRRDRGRAGRAAPRRGPVGGEGAGAPRGGGGDRLRRAPRG